MQRTISDKYSEMVKLQEQMGTGKRLIRPSDAPVDVANDLKLKTTDAAFNQFKKNIDDGIALMNISDTAMSSMNTLMQRLRELGIQAANDTLTGKERGYIQKEVDQLLRQTLTMLNTNYKGDYIFSGSQTKIAPFPVESSRGQTIQNYAQLDMAYYNAGAGVGTYQLQDGFDNSAITNILPGSFHLKVAGVEYAEGPDYTVNYVNGAITVVSPVLAADVTPGTANYAQGAFEISFEYVTKGKDVYGDNVTATGDVLREIENGTAMAVNITGEELTHDNTTGIDMIEGLISFSQNLLQNNRPGIQGSIGTIDKIFQIVLGAQSKNGARVNRFETTLERNEMQTTDNQKLLSELEDVDMADVISKFSIMQNVYSAALKSAATMIQPSLAQYL